jgi:hypothetical protein
MSLDLAHEQIAQLVEITIEYTQSKMVAVSTNSPYIDHFLRKVNLLSCLPGEIAH